MTETTRRYIIGYRHGPRLAERAARALEGFVNEHDEARVVRQTAVGRQIVEMTPEQVRDLAKANPDLVVEEDQELMLFAMPGLPPRVPPGGDFAQPVTVSDAVTGAPIPEVTVYGVGNGVAYKAVTGADGRAELRSFEKSVRQIIVSPRDTYWSRLLDGQALDARRGLEVGLKPLLTNGAYDWGHRMMGFRQVNPVWKGSEVKVAIIDTGVSDATGCLTPAGGWNAFQGADPNTWNVDEKGHGTHCAGIVAACDGAKRVLGGAPEAQVYGVKIFPDGRLSEMIAAVEWCIANRMDIISMSVGVANPSQILAGVLRDAYDRGITCLAAVGNESTHVAYPAAYPTVFGVSAIGCFGTFPEDSAHSAKISHVTDYRGGIFSPNFNSFGSEVNVCAPGVAVLSTVPTGFAAWDGTSMACPMVSALAALVLQAYPTVRTGNAAQPEVVFSILQQSAFNLGMPPWLQGAGLPLAPVALAGAAPVARGYSWPGQPATTC